MPTNKVDKRMNRAFIYSFMGALISKGLIMLTGIVLSRLLGEEEYGKYSLVNSTIQTFVTFASMGIGASLTRYIAIYREKDHDICGKFIGTFLIVITVMSIIISCIVYGCSNSISIWTVESNELTQLYHIAAIVILFIAISSAFQSTLIGFEVYKKISIFEIVYGVISIVLICGTAYFCGIIGAFIGMLVSRLVYSIILFVYSKCECNHKQIKWTVKFDRQIWNEYSKFTLPSFLSSIFVIPVSWVLNSMLTKNAGYLDMAVYSIAGQWVAIVNYVMSLFTRAKPIYTQLYSEKKYDEFRHQLKKVIITSSVIGIGIASFAAMFSKIILGIYGEAYEEHYLVFVIMMLAAAVISMQAQFGSAFEAIGKMWIGLLLNVVWAVNLATFFFLLIDHGALGYAIAYLTAYSIHCILSWLVVAIQLQKVKIEKGIKT